MKPAPPVTRTLRAIVERVSLVGVRMCPGPGARYRAAWRGTRNTQDWRDDAGPNWYGPATDQEGIFRTRRTLVPALMLGCVMPITRADAECSRVCTIRNCTNTCSDALPISPVDGR